jgi:hypothetical protein
VIWCPVMPQSSMCYPKGTELAPECRCGGEEIHRRIHEWMWVYPKGGQKAIERTVVVVYSRACLWVSRGLIARLFFHYPTPTVQPGHGSLHRQYHPWKAGFEASSTFCPTTKAPHPLWSPSIHSMSWPALRHSRHGVARRAIISRLSRNGLLSENLPWIIAHGLRRPLGV